MSKHIVPKSIMILAGMLSILLSVSVYAAEPTLSIVPDAVTLYPGQTAALHVSLSGEDASDPDVTWQSLRPEIASVDENGLVTANTSGDTVVQAVLNDNPDLYATCRIEIAEARPVVSSSNLINLRQRIVTSGQKSNGLPCVSLSDDTGSHFLITYSRTPRDGILHFESSLGNADSPEGSFSVAMDYDIRGQYLLTPAYTIHYYRAGSPAISISAGADSEITTYSFGDSLAIIYNDEHDSSIETVFGSAESFQSAGSEAVSRAMHGWNTLLERNGCSLKRIGFLQCEETISDGMEIEPNDSKLTATPLTLGAPMQGDLDDDYFSVSLEKGKRYRITVDPYEKRYASAGISIGVYPPNSEQAFSVSDVLNKYRVNYCDYSAAKSGIFYIRLNNTAETPAYAEMPYVLTVQEIAFGITLSRTSASAMVGETVSLSMSVQPQDSCGVENDLVWSSSNPAITVENGTVRAKNAGSAVITVTTGDGLFSAKCNVTFSFPQAVTGVRLNPAAITLPAGDAKDLHAILSPANATNKNVTWKSQKPGIARVDEYGRVRGVKQGKTNITVTTSDGGFTASCTVTVLFNDVTDPKKSYYSRIYQMADKGIVNGYGSYFDPDALCTRGQFVLFLWRLAGKPAPKTQVLPYKDKNDIENMAKDYKSAILWGTEKGVIKGYTSGNKKGFFKPYDLCTRAQVVMFIWRYMGRPASSGSLPFIDETQIRGMSADYGRAISWASEKKIACGYSDGTFKPHRNCTRSECVTFLYRIM